MLKKGIINQLKTICGMIVFNIISAILFGVAYANMTVLQESPLTGGILPSTGYELNLYFYIPSIIILLILYAVFCFIFLRQKFDDACKIHLGFTISFIIVIILFIIIEYFILVMVVVSSTGLFSVIVNSPIVFNIILLSGFVTLPIIMMIYAFIRNKKTNN